MPALRPVADDDDDCEFSLVDKEAASVGKNPPPLSLDLNSKTSELSTGYGLLPVKPTVFGLNAKRILIRSGAALEKSISSPDECLFLTATLPGSTNESFRAIAEWSGYAVNSLKAWVSNHVAAKLDFYCWEYQKRGALHLHYCVHAKDKQARSHIQRGFHSWWIQLLDRISEKSGVDLFRKNDKFTHRSDTSKVRAVAEICRKSPARYLAKYLSKSAKGMKGRAKFFTPSRWWGTSRPLKKILESMTEIVEIIEGGYFGCIRKMQEIKAVFETCEGAGYRFRHKYGMGESLVLYPDCEFSNIKLFEELEDMTIATKIEKQMENFIPSKMLRPHKSRLLAWAYRWIHELPRDESGMIETLKEFYDALFSMSPSSADEPLYIIYDWRNRLWNLNQCIGYSKCGRNYNDRNMIDSALCDLEIAIDYICTKGWK